MRNATHGTIKIDSDEGPIVGRLVDSDGVATPGFTIPTESDLSLKAGEYTLHMSAGGKLGEAQRVSVNEGRLTKVKTKLSDNGVFPERTIEGFPAVLPLDGRDDLILFHQRGITRVDGRSGENLWTAKADEFVELANRLTEKEKQAAKNKYGQSKERLVGKVAWAKGFNQISRFDDPRIPVVVEGFSDVTGDGKLDVLVACMNQTATFAFDGVSGEPIWHYVSDTSVPEEERHGRHNLVATVERPQLIGDIDSDGSTDFACIYCSKSHNTVYRWADAVSGKTGKRIWRKELPEKWFDVGKAVVPELAFKGHSNGFQSRHMNTSGGRFKVREGRPFRGRGQGKIMPWQWIFAENHSESEEMLVCCGSRLISMNRKTGQPGKFNDGQPLDLGFFPALPPKSIPDGNGGCLGILLCEVVSYSDPNRRVAPLTRFSLRSIESGKEIWSHDAVCDPSLLAFAPDWPVVADLVGDATPEILISDDNELDAPSYVAPVSMSSLQVLDAKTGKELWVDDQKATIRCQDRQIQNVIVGPDADGDQKPDVYAVTASLGSEALVHVDILSAVSGGKIRTLTVDDPMFDPLSLIHI